MLAARCTSSCCCWTRPARRCSTSACLTPGVVRSVASCAPVEAELLAASPIAVMYALYVDRFPSLEHPSPQRTRRTTITIAAPISPRRRRRGVRLGVPRGRDGRRGGRPPDRGPPPPPRFAGSSLVASSTKSKSRMSSSCTLTGAAPGRGGRLLRPLDRRVYGMHRIGRTIRDRRESRSDVSNAAYALPNRELVLDRYRPLRPIGRGGSGSVWLARDERSGLEVALKIVPREGKRAARAMREMEAASRLRHDRCVRAYDFGGDEGHVYITYEYVEGSTMRELMRSGKLTDRDAVEIAAQILEGLAHAHQRGIVHRDVKPSNVIVSDAGGRSVKLLDFGLAQFDEADTLTAIGDVPGTLAYIAPERLAGKDASARSDVWAVGVLLWEALASEHPFWGVPLPEVASTIAAGAPPLAGKRPDLPRRLLALVDAALSVDPAKRPSAKRLSHELREAFASPRRARDRPERPARPPKASA
ncbi:MAG: serine/threonine protein kinase, partial [Actinobacteria bacterium]|nr:serine/threonine protein kinase [Actinomycetota bacterium]